jgi:hypothetical protein
MMYFKSLTIKPFMILYGIGFLVAMLSGPNIVWALIFLGLGVFGPECELEWKKSESTTKSMAREMARLEMRSYRRGR